MCADGSEERLKDAVGECKDCGGRIDIEGYTVEECCNYAQETCEACGNAPCTQFC